MQAARSPLGQGQVVPGLDGVGCPLQGPQAVEKKGIEGDEDNEAADRSEVRGQG